MQKTGLKPHPSPESECVTQGLGEAILFNQDLETLSIDTSKTLSERASDLFSQILNDAKAIGTDVIRP